MPTAPSPLMSQCPACTNVSLGLHCSQAQSVTTCDWRSCKDTSCQAQFDIIRGIGHRLATERGYVKDKNGQDQIVRVRMMRVGGDWRDDPRDGA